MRNVPAANRSCMHIFRFDRKERMRRIGSKGAEACYRRRESVSASKKQFAAIRRPDGLSTSVRRNSMFFSTARIGLDVNFAASGFPRYVRHPTTIRRQFRVAKIETGLEEQLRFSI